VPLCLRGSNQSKVDPKNLSEASTSHVSEVKKNAATYVTALKIVIVGKARVCAAGGLPWQGKVGMGAEKIPCRHRGC
jgi:hypothetical protein